MNRPQATLQDILGTKPKPNTRANCNNEYIDSQETLKSNLKVGYITSPETFPDKFYLHHNPIHEFIRPADVNEIRKYDGGCV